MSEELESPLEKLEATVSGIQRASKDKIIKASQEFLKKPDMSAAQKFLQELEKAASGGLTPQDDTVTVTVTISVTTA